VPFQDKLSTHDVHCFQGLLSFYDDYAQLLAGWGYAVLQYDLKCTSLPFGGPCPQLQNIPQEEAALPSVLRWAQQALSNADVAAHIQWGVVGVAGHSRGGDVSFHQQGLFDFVQSAALLDPVLHKPGRDMQPATKPVLVIGVSVLALLGMHALSLACNTCANTQIVPCTACIVGKVWHALSLCFSDGQFMV
jgi:hypothetical protein